MGEQGSDALAIMSSVSQPAGPSATSASPYAIYHTYPREGRRGLPQIERHAIRCSSFVQSAAEQRRTEERVLPETGSSAEPGEPRAPQSTSGAAQPAPKAQPLPERGSPAEPAEPLAAQSSSGVAQLAEPAAPPGLAPGVTVDLARDLGPPCVPIFDYAAALNYTSPIRRGPVGRASANEVLKHYRRISTVDIVSLTDQTVLELKAWLHNHRKRREIIGPGIIRFLWVRFDIHDPSAGTSVCRRQHPFQ